MGPRVMRRLPKFVHALHRPTWQAAVLFPPAGFKRMPLPGLPWSPEFMAAYEAGLAGQPRPIGSRSEAGHIARAGRQLFRQPGISDKAAKHPTHLSRDHRAALRRARRQAGRPHAPRACGRLIAARAETARAANALRRALRAMMQHAVEIGIRADDPTGM